MFNRELIPQRRRDRVRSKFYDVAGPAVIAEKNATTVVEPGWQAVLTAAGPIELTRVVPRPTQHAIGTDADPVMLEVFNNLFMNIAEQMGLRLQNTAYSVNIKERLDFSCALFDAEGRLIANAPHMPVHLGSMGESVRTILRLRRGEVAGLLYDRLEDLRVVEALLDAGAVGHRLHPTGQQGDQAQPRGGTPWAGPEGWIMGLAQLPFRRFGLPLYARSGIRGEIPVEVRRITITDRTEPESKSGRFVSGGRLADATALR